MVTRARRDHADPRTGQPYFVWTQLDQDQPNSPTDGVYLYQPPPHRKGPLAFTRCKDRHLPGQSHRRGDPAIGIAADGTIYIVYSRSEKRSSRALLEERQQHRRR